jgi:hypothetical protein
MTEHLCGLPRTAALCTLAQCVYAAWGSLYRLDTPHWDELMPEERHFFVARVQDLMDGLTTDPCALPLLELVVRSRSRVIPFPSEVPHV